MEPQALPDAPHPRSREALLWLEREYEPRYLSELERLSAIPSISFAGFDPGPVRASAEATADLLRASGLENVALLEFEGTHPYVYGERLRAPGAPTVLLYAHHDVQPVGREELWQSPPFVPTRRVGPGGLRLYGRGTADDKAGILVHAAAIDAILRTTQELPLNVKVIIEGEEEIGSPSLARFLARHRALVQADVMVLTDVANFDVGVPALTVALRGLVALEVEVRALAKSVHSGMWGGPLPDPVQGLAKMLATLSDRDGEIAVAGVREGVQPLSAVERDEAARIPFDEAVFREQSGLLPDARLFRSRAHPELSPLVRTWREPSLTVTAIQASSRASAPNIINDAAWAKVTVRIVPDQNPEQVLQALEAHLRAAAPWGLQVTIRPESATRAWSTRAQGPAFAAAQAALTAGYGVRPITLGCGGTIPFVEPLSDALGGVPALLLGVEDPHTNAHGENESVLIADLKRAIASEIDLFYRLSDAMKSI